MQFLNVVFASGCVFTLSFALIAAAEINASVPMILVGRIIGGLAVGQSFSFSWPGFFVLESWSHMQTWRFLQVMSIWCDFWCHTFGFGFLGPNFKFSYDWSISNDFYQLRKQGTSSCFLYGFIWLLMTSQVIIFSKLGKGELLLFWHKSL